MSTADRSYLSVTETAKLVRKALKADFPGTKFSVRSDSYAGGAAVRVSWTDGPTRNQVDGTLHLYEGASFDGMTDMKDYHDSMLMTEDGPKVVHFGADFVQGQREISPMRRAIYRVELERFIGRKLDRDNLYNERVPAGFGHYYSSEFEGKSEHPALSHDDHGVEYAGTLINQMAHMRSWKGEKCPGGGDVYCEGCGRYQRGHEQEPHLR